MDSRFGMGGNHLFGCRFGVFRVCDHCPLGQRHGERRLCLRCMYMRAVLGCVCPRILARHDNHRSENQVTTLRFQFELIAWFEMERFPHRIRNGEPPLII